LHVVVVTKVTPDTAAKIEVDGGGKVNWGNAQLVLNPWDEYSVTEAVILKEAHNVKTTVITVGNDAHADALKQALAIGMDEAVRVWDAGMENADSLTVASAVAAAIKKLGDVSLVIFGKEFADLSTDAHVYQVARKLGYGVVGGVTKINEVNFGAKTIKVTRALEEGKQTVSAKLPLVISVLKEINDPRTPSFIGIRKAGKANIPVLSSTDLGLSAGTVQTQVAGYKNLPARTGSVEIIEGASEQEKAEKLVEKLLAEKII
jgi:electron transfer flavoprotein beta subunit